MFIQSKRKKWSLKLLQTGKALQLAVKCLGQGSDICLFFEIDVLECSASAKQEHKSGRSPRGTSLFIPKKFQVYGMIEHQDAYHV